MRITFTIEESDYLDFVLSEGYKTGKREDLKIGDTIGVRLQSSQVYRYRRIPKLDKKQLKHLVLNIYAFAGIITKHRDGDKTTEVMVDCGIPIRMCLDRRFVKFKEGDNIVGVLHLDGSIGYETGTLAQAVTGKVVENKMIETLTKGEKLIFITMDVLKVSDLVDLKEIVEESEPSNSTISIVPTEFDLEELKKLEDEEIETDGYAEAIMDELHKDKKLLVYDKKKKRLRISDKDKELD